MYEKGDAMQRLSLFGVFTITMFWGLSACIAGTILSDPLSGSTTGNKKGGSFKEAGWQAPHQIWWDAGKAMNAGSLTVEVTNWNPNSDSPQHKHGKQQIINMYEASHGSSWDANNSKPMTSFFNIRTGASYDNCFKFLSSPAGFEERIETRVKKSYGTINPPETHVISVTWTAAGDITAYLDGVAEVTHKHGKPFALRYIFLGTDNTIPGTYGPQHNVIYKNLVVEDNSTSVPVDPNPGPGDPLKLSPIDDTWADPLALSTINGNSTELRVGGDGRTIFMKFDVAGVGPIESATLNLKAMNGGYGGDVRVVGDTSWSEDTLNYQNMPTPDSAILGSLGAVSIGDIYKMDVSKAVPCDGTYTFAINSSEVDGAGYWSSESSEYGPELVLVPDPKGGTCDEPPPDPTPEPDAGPSPDADAGPTMDAGPAQEDTSAPDSSGGDTNKGLPYVGPSDDARSASSSGSSSGGCHLNGQGAGSPLAVVGALVLMSLVIRRRKTADLR
jgi:hypothetical protein